MILIDSNVLLDIFTKDPNWFQWSSEKLMECFDKYTLAINPIIYAEVSIGFKSIEELEEALPFNSFECLPLNKEIAFLAGKCFLKYKKRGGQKGATLPDFFIGAHASILNIPLLTRDQNRYQDYFPKLKLISPSPYS